MTMQKTRCLGMHVQKVTLAVFLAALMRHRRKHSVWTCTAAGLTIFWTTPAGAKCVAIERHFFDGKPPETVVYRFRQ